MIMIKKIVQYFINFLQTWARSTKDFEINARKPPSIGVLIKRCSENMQKIYCRTHAPKCDFNKNSK